MNRLRCCLVSAIVLAATACQNADPIDSEPVEPIIDNQYNIFVHRNEPDPSAPAGVHAERLFFTVRDAGQPVTGGTVRIRVSRGSLDADRVTATDGTASVRWGLPLPLRVELDTLYVCGVPAGYNCIPGQWVLAIGLSETTSP